MRVKLWEDALQSYLSKTPRSKEVYSKACRLLVGGVNHNLRYFKPYPFSVSRASAQYFWDIDGNRYCDYWMGHTALILGHSPKVVVEALSQQVPNGTHYGVVNEDAVELAERVNRSVPCAELIRFCNTGAEATMYAVRLARAFTKKRILVKVEGGWHGYSTPLLKGVTSPFELPESGGLLEENLKYVRLVPFNSIDRAVETMRECRDDLACFILEPILGAGGCIPAEKDYLSALREETERLDALLIFDEIVSGFRVALGGSQERYGIKPDLCTLGKILGGGLPIGAVCGRRDIMSLADTTKKSKTERCWIGGGTFSSNPITMVAGNATLKFLQENREQVYSRIERLGEVGRKGIDKVFHDRGINTLTTGVGSLIVTHFLRPGQTSIKDAKDVDKTDKEARYSFYLALLAKHDIFFLPGHSGAISYAHTEEDIRHLIDTADRLAEEVKNVE